MSKQHKILLQYFLNSPDTTLSKENLIEKVWKGRMVAGNTIDQSLSKLKKILNDCQPDIYFETVYGQGIRFLPKVYKSHKKFNRIKLIVLFIILSLSIILYVLQDYYSSAIVEKDTGFTQRTKQMFLMVVPQLNQIKDSNTDNAWLNKGSSIVFEQLIKYSEFFQLKSYTKKPANLNHQQYLEYLWGISHDLNTLSVSLLQNNNTYTLELVLTSNKQLKSSYKWSDEKLNSVFLHANKWLEQQFSQSTVNIYNKNLLPESSYLLELYMRGLSSLTQNNLSKASRFFEININDNPAFHLARLELAKIRLIQGKSKQAMILLDAMDFNNLPVKLNIEVTQLCSHAYMLENKTEQAIDILKNTIIKFKASDYPEIHELRYKLSSIYLNLEQHDLALKELNNISTDVSKKPELVAQLLQRQAFIYLNSKRFKKAKETALQALGIYLKLGDSLGMAKTHQLLAKIATKQLDYQSAEIYLQQSLSIYRSLTVVGEDNVGSVENLTELISVLIEQGQLAKAKILNTELQQLTKKHHLSNKLIDSMTYTIIMNMMQRKWSSAKQGLQKHKIIASETNNKIALINNQLLNVELLLDQNMITDVKSLLLKLQEDIDKMQHETFLIRVKILQARYFMLSENTQKGTVLLIAAKTFAQSLQDNKALVKINNILAQQYLDDKQSNNAITVLRDSTDFKPFAYPYLLLKSKANTQLGNNMKALELAIESKSKSYQFWSANDEEYLQTLIEQNKSL